MLQKEPTYDGFFQSFRWQIPEYDNIGVGPAEIEDCLIKHSAAAISAVVGKPDKVRTEVVNAFAVLKAGVSGSEDLAREIRECIKTRLAAHEYPREIELLSELPMTSTGKASVVICARMKSGKCRMNQP